MEYDVATITGGYADTFTLNEAREIARDESRDSIRFVIEAEWPRKIVFVYIEGIEYAPTDSKNKNSG